MSTRYYRIQTADRDVADLLDPEQQWSYSWCDEEREPRHGVSVCDSIEALATYLAQCGIPYGDGEWVVVEVEGTFSRDEDEDAHLGALLVHPTAIVSVSPMGEGMFDLIGAAYDRLAA